MKEPIEDKVENWIGDFLNKVSDRMMNEDIVSMDIDTVWNLKGKGAGQARGKKGCNKGTIRLNKQLKKLDENNIRNTVGHELAHLICYYIYPGCQPHGREWKKIMKLMGLAPERCHNYDFKPARKTKRFKYVCEKCGHSYSLTTYKHNKLKINPRYYVCKCNGLIKYKGEEI